MSSTRRKLVLHLFGATRELMVCNVIQTEICDGSGPEISINVWIPFSDFDGSTDHTLGDEWGWDRAIYGIL